MKRAVSCALPCSPHSLSTPFLPAAPRSPALSPLFFGPPPACSYLVIKRPWPSMMRTVAGDHPRFEQTYFSHYKGYYFTGDGARRDEDG